MSRSYIFLDRLNSINGEILIIIKMNKSNYSKIDILEEVMGYLRYVQNRTYFGLFKKRKCQFFSYIKIKKRSKLSSTISTSDQMKIDENSFSKLCISFHFFLIYHKQENESSGKENIWHKTIKRTSFWSIEKEIDFLKIIFAKKKKIRQLFICFLNYSLLLLYTYVQMILNYDLIDDLIK